tara:strand:- start:133 stop:321 length:189 start_codon:yes stop_codon:yes gene_type:complete
MDFSNTTVKYIKESHDDSNTGIRVEFSNDEVWCVPIDLANSYYAEIMRQVDAGELTIEPADE